LGAENKGKYLRQVDAFIKEKESAECVSTGSKKMITILGIGAACHIMADMASNKGL